VFGSGLVVFGLWFALVGFCGFVVLYFVFLGVGSLCVCVFCVNLSYCAALLAFGAVRVLVVCGTGLM